MNHTIAAILCISSLLLSGCNNSTPVVAEAETLDAPTNLKVFTGPVPKQPPIKYWWLEWFNTNNPPSMALYVEVYHSTDWSNWDFLGYSTSNRFKIFSNKPHDYYRVRNCQYDPPNLCSVWATTPTNH